MTNEFDPTEALAAANSARKSLADRLYTPVWYHPILGLLIGALCLLIALPKDSFAPLWRIPLIVVIFIDEILLLKTYIKITGVTITSPVGIRSKKALAYAAAGISLPLLIALVSAAVCGPGWIAIACAVVAATLTIVLGRRYDEALRTDLCETESR